MSRPYVESHHGAFIIGARRDPDSGERGRLVQVDWDYPAEAQALGWNMRRVQRRPAEHSDLSALCRCGETVFLKRAPNRGKGCCHRGTDGTINCAECGVTASEFITAAGEYISSLCRARRE